MNDLAFLSVDAAERDRGFLPIARSPLERALVGARGIRDLSSLGKLEVRGPVERLDADGYDVIPVGPQRALVVCARERCAALQQSLPGIVVDMTGALAGIEVTGERLLRRLTDLDLDALPAVGNVAGVPAALTRDDSSFRIFFPQEYGDSVVLAVRDLMRAL
jgi:hypothetical protein